MCGLFSVMFWTWLHGRDAVSVFLPCPLPLFLFLCGVILSEQNLVRVHPFLDMLWQHACCSYTDLRGFPWGRHLPTPLEWSFHRLFLPLTCPSFMQLGLSISVWLFLLMRISRIRCLTSKIPLFLLTCPHCLLHPYESAPQYGTLVSPFSWALALSPPASVPCHNSISDSVACTVSSVCCWPGPHGGARDIYCQTNG